MDKMWCVCECDQNTPYEHNNHTQQSEDIIQYNRSKQSHSYMSSVFFAFESADDELNRFVSFCWCLYQKIVCRKYWKRQSENSVTLKRQWFPPVIMNKVYIVSRLNVHWTFFEFWYWLWVHYHYDVVDESIQWEQHSLTSEYSVCLF